LSLYKFYNTDPAKSAECKLETMRVGRPFSKYSS